MAVFVTSLIYRAGTADFGGVQCIVILEEALRRAFVFTEPI